MKRFPRFRQIKNQGTYPSPAVPVSQLIIWSYLSLVIVLWLGLEWPNTWANNRARIEVLRQASGQAGSFVPVADAVETSLDSRWLTTVGYLYQIRGDASAAIDAWHAAFGIDGNLYAGVALGWAYEGSGREDRALDAWCRVNDPALVIYFERLQQENQRDAALSQRYTAILVSLHRCWTERLSPVDPAHWLHLGRAAELKGDIESALQAYARGLELSPADRDLFSAKFGLEFETHRFGEAAQTALSRLAVVPDDHRLPGQLGNALFYDGHYAEARPWLEKAMARQPAFRAGFAHMLCVSDNEVRDYIAAVRHCLQALADTEAGAAPDRWRYYAELSRAYTGQGDILAAIEAQKQALQCISACSWEEYLTLGKLYESVGDTAAAKAAYLAALNCDPKATEAQDALEALEKQ